jgi:site-specific recombinase XerC
MNRIHDQAAGGNLRAVQPLLGHRKLESTVRYLGIEVDEALSISEQVEL